MRKGSSLIEAMIVLTIIVALIAVAMSLESAALQDLPRDAAISRTSTLLQNMLQTLRQDVQSAVSIDAGADKATIQAKGGSIVYSRKDDTFTRTFIPAGGKADVRTWRLRDADVQWQTWAQGNRKYAMEVRTAFVTRQQNRTTRKLANSQVFFMAAEGVR